ncbi:hypothetical protein L1887_51312 [Cichorium endivia]|nr:hypothetical protein L1887_51312 [Cichorium endivia]
MLSGTAADGDPKDAETDEEQMLDQRSADSSADVRLPIRTVPTAQHVGVARLLLYPRRLDHARSSPPRARPTFCASPRCSPNRSPLSPSRARWCAATLWSSPLRCTSPTQRCSNLWASPRRRHRGLADTLCTGSQQLLWSSNFLQSQQLEHLACICLLGVYQHNRKEQADGQWALLGSAIKVAQNIGLARLDHGPTSHQPSVEHADRGAARAGTSDLVEPHLARLVACGGPLWRVLGASSAEIARICRPTSRSTAIASRCTRPTCTRTRRRSRCVCAYVTLLPRDCRRLQRALAPLSSSDPSICKQAQRGARLDTGVPAILAAAHVCTQGVPVVGQLHHPHPLAARVERDPQVLAGDLLSAGSGHGAGDGAVLCASARPGCDGGAGRICRRPSRCYPRLGRGSEAARNSRRILKELLNAEDKIREAFARLGGLERIAEEKLDTSGTKDVFLGRAAARI